MDNQEHCIVYNGPALIMNAGGMRGQCGRQVDDDDVGAGDDLARSGRKLGPRVSHLISQLAASGMYFDLLPLLRSSRFTPIHRRNVMNITKGNVED